MPLGEESPGTGESLGSRQLQLNRATAGEWESYASHRRRVMRLVLEAAEGGRGRLCVVGAGNCNDLDLPRLIDRFDEIHLVDLDGEALAGALTRQGVSFSRNVTIHEGVDLAGTAALASGWAADGPSLGEVESFCRRSRTYSPKGIGPAFEVVLSAGILSQLVLTASKRLGPEDPRTLELVLAVRDGHLRLLADLLRPGGRGVLVGELVSTDTFPELVQLPEEIPAQIVPELVSAGNFFTGSNPMALGTRLMATGFIESVSLGAPWRWHIGDQRAYLAYALSFRRRPLP